LHQKIIKKSAKTHFFLKIQLKRDFKAHFLCKKEKFQNGAVRNIIFLFTTNVLAVYAECGGFRGRSLLGEGVAEDPTWVGNT